MLRLYVSEMYRRSPEVLQLAQKLWCPTPEQVSPFRSLLVACTRKVDIFGQVFQ